MFQIQTKEMPAWECEPEPVPVMVCVRLRQAVENEDLPGWPFAENWSLLIYVQYYLGPSAAVLLLNISNEFNELAIDAGLCPSGVDRGFAL